MLVLGLDLETTGVDFGTDQIIEIGAVLWDAEKHKPLQMISEIVIPGPNTIIPENIQKLVGITQEDLEQWGKPIKDVLEQVLKLAEHAEYIVAHNGNQFDSIFLKSTLSENGLPELKTPWIDTLTDLPYGEDIKTRKLSYLAAEHGFLNHFSHRALFDVLTMLKVLGHYDIQYVAMVQASPLKKVIAHVSYENRGLARQAGFRWDSQKKIWYLDIRQILIPSMDFPFETSIQ